MAFVVWWFFGRSESQGSATESGNTQNASITVNGGYNPEITTVQAHKPVTLTFRRKDASGCLEEVIFPDFGIQKKLELNGEDIIELPELEPGEYAYSCGMRMYHGKVVVK